MADSRRGLFQKYVVYELSEDGQQSAMPVDERVFVLKPSSDPYALSALIRYAQAAHAGSHTNLASDLREWANNIIQDDLLPRGRPRRLPALPPQEPHTYDKPEFDLEPEGYDGQGAPIYPPQKP